MASLLQGLTGQVGFRHSHRVISSRSSGAASVRRCNYSKKLTVSLNTPDKTIWDSVSADLITVPGSVSEFTLAPEATPVFAQLKPGIVRLTNEGEDTRYFVSGGFAAALENSIVKISVGDAYGIDQLDADSAAKLKSAAEAKMNAESGEDRAIAQITLETADAVLKALNK